MADLVALAEAKEFIRVVHDDEDTTIVGLIAAASDAVTELADNWDGVGDTPERLKLATLMLVADWFDNREASETMRHAVPHGVRWLTTPFRNLET